jgi:hypothetical protein
LWLLLLPALLLPTPAYVINRPAGLISFIQTYDNVSMMCSLVGACWRQKRTCELAQIAVMRLPGGADLAFTSYATCNNTL